MFRHLYSFLICSLSIHTIINAQNTGIGTNSPQATLHVNGDLKLQFGDAINNFSRDSLFSANSHLKVPTEKAVKDFIQRGNWLASDYTVAGPNAPAYLGYAMLTPEQANGVACSGNFAYLIGYNSDMLSIVDISDPKQLKKRGVAFDNLNVPTSIAAQGNFVYITCSGNNKLCIFDVSNPDLPIARGTISTSLDYPRDVAVNGNYVYVTSDFSGRLSVFDVSNPDAIVLKSTGGVGLGGITALDVQGNYVYITSTLGGELHIYDVSNPLVVVFRGFARFEINSPRDVSVSGNMAYVASQDNNSIVTYDISNPAAPVHKGSIAGAVISPNYVIVIGNYLAVTNAVNNRLTILDITTPGSIRYIGSNNGHIVQATGLAVLGNTICVSNKGDVRALCLFDLDLSRSMGVSGNGVVPTSQQWQSQANNVYRSNGYVGIGTSAPSQALDVVGNINTSGEVRGASLNVNNAAIASANISTGVFNSGTFTNTYTYNAGVNGQLAFSNLLDSKISFYGYGTASQYGIGVQSGLLQLYTDASAADIAFGYGSSSSFTERMRIKGNGNVGIGLTNPSNPLSFPATLAKKISLYPGSTGDVGMSVSGNDFRLYSDNVNARISFGYDSYISGFTSRAYVPATGVVAMVVQGQLNVNGTIYNSDVRYKKNILIIDNSLDKLMKLRGVVYEMRVDQFPTLSFESGQQMGLIAQEVEKVVPEVVSTNNEGFKSVDYAKLVPLLIESIKEQQKLINEIKLQCLALEKIVLKQQQELEILRKR